MTPEQLTEANEAARRLFAVLCELESEAFDYTYDHEAEASDRSCRCNVCNIWHELYRLTEKLKKEAK